MAMRSWLDVAPNSDFSLLNIPFGIISPYPGYKVPAIAIGDYCLDLRGFSEENGFAELGLDLRKVLYQDDLNAFASMGRKVHQQVRKYLQDILKADTPYSSLLKDNERIRHKCIFRRDRVVMHLPMKIGDYTDFYAGKHHAFNVGCLFRGPENALQPNYTHLPVGYHGRASSVVVSGTPIRRPRGQILEDAAAAKQPVLGSCRRLDFELELGAFLCSGNLMGESIDIGIAENSIFGIVLMNDWSARDIQAWEYVPLGPFNAKNFGTTISPWIILIDALADFKTAGIHHENDLLPYLREKTNNTVYDMHLEVDLITKDGTKTTISRTNAKNLLYSFPQMIAHHTVGGCPMNTGDLLGSGTISGTEKGTEGALIEITQGGKKKIILSDGQERMFLLDSDTVVLRGRCGTIETGMIGFGDCCGTIVSAPS